MKNLLIFIVAIFLDRATKFWAQSENFAVKNHGIAFSMFENHPQISFLLALVALTVFVVFFVRARGKNNFWMVLLLAGAVSNLADRIIYGYVIDWIHVFVYINVADIFLCVGAAGILLIPFIDKTRH